MIPNLMDSITHYKKLLTTAGIISLDPLEFFRHSSMHGFKQAHQYNNITQEV